YAIIFPNSVPERPLHIGIDIHFNRPIRQGVLNFGRRRTGTTMENKVHRFIGRDIELLTNVILRVLKNNWLEFHISRLINTVYVSKCSSYRKLVRYRA